MTVGAVLKAKDASVVSVKPSATVQEVAEIITSRRIGAVLVLDEAGAVVGIVSVPSRTHCAADAFKGIATAPVVPQVTSVPCSFRSISTVRFGVPVVEMTPMSRMS